MTTSSDAGSAFALGEFLDSLDRRMISLTRRIAFAGVTVMLLLAFGTVADVLLRWLFNAPICGFNEILSMGLAVAISATFPAGAAQRVNLTVDFLSRRLSPRALARLKLIGAVALLLFYALLSWRIGEYAADLMGRNAVTLYLSIPHGAVMALRRVLPRGQRARAGRRAPGRRQVRARRHARATRLEHRAERRPAPAPAPASRWPTGR